MGASGLVVNKNFPEYLDFWKLITIFVLMKIKINTIVGNWKVISEEYRNDNILWHDCECICGKIRPVRKWWLNNHKSKGCGCTNVKNRFKSECVGLLSKSYYNSFKRMRIKKGIKFDDDVTMSFLWDLFNKQNGKCALSGIDIYLNPQWSKQNKGFEVDIKQTASIDRIDSTLGYSLNNIQWVHKDINYMKGSLSDLDFINYCKLVTINDEKIKYARLT